MNRISPRKQHVIALITILIVVSIITIAAKWEQTQPHSNELRTAAEEDLSDHSDSLRQNSVEIPTVNQGDPIEMGSDPIGGLCTIGYVDKKKRVGYTAAHCIKNKYHGATDTVLLDNSELGFGIEVGTIEQHPRFQEWDPTGIRYDIAIIHFNDDVIIGDNIYSGDTLIGEKDVHEGDHVCLYGRSSLESSCGEVHRWKDADNFETTIRSRDGDSGGPVWKVSEKGEPLGLVGIHNYNWNDKGGRGESGHTFTDYINDFTDEFASK